EYSTDEAYGDAQGAQQTPWWCLSVPLPRNKETRPSTIVLHQRPYFGEDWVLQRILPFSTVSVLREKIGLEPELCDFLYKYKTEILAEVATNILRTLMSARSRECLDPRDKVYGILGMISPSMVKLIYPSYDVLLYDTNRNMIPGSHPSNSASISHLMLLARSERKNRKLALMGSRLDCRLEYCALVHTGLLMQYVKVSTLEVVGIECASLSAVRYISPATEMIRSLSIWTPGDLHLKPYPGGGSLCATLWEAVTRDECAIVMCAVPTIPNAVGLYLRCHGAMSEEDLF
ncbi:hypothetical protein LB504_009299, partial [Fusarium proliferatum]